MLNRNIKKHPRELNEQQKDSEGAGEGERTAHFLFSLFSSAFFFFSPFFISFRLALSERLEQAHETKPSDKRCDKNR